MRSTLALSLMLLPLLLLPPPSFSEDTGDENTAAETSQKSSITTKPSAASSDPKSAGDPPASDDSKPAGGDPPASDDSKPASDDSKLAGGDPPASDDSKPASDDSKPAGGDPPASDDSKPAGGDPPASDDSKPAGGDPPASDDSKPVGGDPPASDDSKPAGSDPQTDDSKPAGGDPQTHDDLKSISDPLTLSNSQPSKQNTSEPGGSETIIQNVPQGDKNPALSNTSLSSPDSNVSQIISSTTNTSMPQTTSSLSTTKKPDLFGGPSTHGTTTFQSMVLVSPSDLPTTPLASQHQPTNGQQHSPATLPSSSASATGPDFVSTASAMTATHTPPLEETQHTSVKTLDGSLSFSTSPQPTGSSVVTGTTSAVGGATRPSTNLTPAAPQGSTLPSPIWPFGNKKVICDPAIRPSEELLILNLTEANLCTGSPPDEKLVELLCRSVKASSFNAAQDQCTLQLAPVLEGQAVAVKRIIIETKLPPKAVYELLKDKWDDLREAGVSDMQLGKEGPPEDNEDRFSLPLIITIVCMASFLLLVAALYGCCHQRISQRKDQQRLTEELQTVENGYHDNPTLEVMETSSEMQEKKVVNLNGELADSWIVPLDNLTKDDLDEEEDTHL